MSTHTVDSVGTPTIATTRWRIDPARSSVEFHVKGFWGMATVKGRFSRYHGTLDLSTQPAIELTIEADSVDTTNEKRDTHLRSPDFFDAEQHPYIRFVSDSATLDGQRLHVRGRLHARGSSIPLELDATLRRIGDDLEIEAATEADHRQLGMSWNRLSMIRTPSKLMVTGRLVRDAA
ncbi:MAG: YceI family protein [Solirubrobacteraceae bacterium]